jgi:hypothetical protein
LQPCSNWRMTAGEISPAVRTGTLDGEFCLTEAIGVLFEGMVRRSPKGRVTTVINCGVGDAFVFTKMCWIKGGSGSDSLSMVTHQKTVQFSNVCAGRKAETVMYALTDVALICVFADFISQGVQTDPKTTDVS